MSAWDTWRDGFKRRQERDKPKQQIYGGSQEALDEQRGKSDIGIASGNAKVTRGLDDSREATDRANEQYGAQQKDLEGYRADQGMKADKAGQGFGDSMADYRQGRGAIIGNAGKLEREFANANTNYQQTSDKAFQANQNRNTRNALALGARGGAGGIRTALASSTNANSDAAAQAEITRANENNQLLGLKQNALESASNIRSNVGAQDQAAAGQYSGREQNADANQFGATQAMSANTANQAQLGQNLGAQSVEAGTAQRGQYLDYRSNMDNAQLNADREREQLRVQGREKRRDFLRNPLGF